MKKFIFILLYLAFSFVTNAQSYQLQSNWPQPNGTVWAMVKDTVTKRVYIGGTFTMVGNVARNAIACIDSNGVVTSWNPDASDWVRTLAISGNTIYAGGTFSNIGGQDRLNIAGIDMNTGLATEWRAYVENNTGVYRICVSGNILYVSGSFSSINGQSRNRIAALSAVTGNVTSWNPNSNGEINSIVVSGDKVYVAGDFTQIGGQRRNRIAALEAATGLATSWNPDVNKQISVIVATDNTIYAGGIFDTVGGQRRNRIAAINATTGAVTSWNPEIGSWRLDITKIVHSLSISGDRIYAGGVFEVVNGKYRGNIAGIKLGSGVVDWWDADMDAAILQIAEGNGMLHLAGNFRTVGIQNRESLATFSVKPCSATQNSVTTSACNGFLLHNKLYTQSGTYKDTLQSAGGCDSIVTLTLTITTAAKTETVSACNSYIFNGKTYTETGTYKDIISNPSGCDTIVTLNITIRESSLVCDGSSWTAQESDDNLLWKSITYGNGLFVAVGGSGVMTSLDGINWTMRNAAENIYWQSVTYGNGLFVAVSANGNSQVMTSPDGINWTTRKSAGNNYWLAIAYGNGLFVAVAEGPSSGQRVMTSPDGIKWTLRNVPDNEWGSITYGNGRFVVMAKSNIGQIITSTDGINWTLRKTVEKNRWWGVTYGNGLFVAVAPYGTHQVITSPDGINWTGRNAANKNAWIGITYGNGYFVAVSVDGSGNRVMTSPDGVNWTSRNSANGFWTTIAHGKGRFVAIAENGSIRSMSSLCQNFTSTISACGSYAFNSKIYEQSGIYHDTLQSSQGCDSIITLDLTLNKPGALTIMGDSAVVARTSHTYSVAHKAGSVYQWIILNGTQTHGGTTNNINVQWDSVGGKGSVKVIEKNSFGCAGDTFELAVAIDSIWLTATPLKLDYTNLAGSKQVSVTGNSGWTASASESWVTLNRTSGKGNNTINISVTPNTLQTTRTAVVTMLSANISIFINIKQDSTPADFLRLNPDSISTPSTGGNYTVTVNSNTTWAITEVPSWILISTTGGSNNGTINIVVGGNSGADRNATIIAKAGNLIHQLKVSQVARTGLDENQISDKIHIYPNPAHRNISIRNEAGAIHASIMDVNGKEIMSFKEQGHSEQTYDLSLLSSGIYTIRLSSGNAITYKKIIILN